jgi:AraC-like DNA-binding protein
MYLWEARFQTLGSMNSLPRLRVVASEVQYDASYRLSGSRRRGESYCLFKYTLEGEGAFRDAAGEHRLPPGSGFLTRISDPETAYYYPRDARGAWSFVWLAFDGDAGLNLVDEMVARYGHVYRLPRSSGAINQMMSFGAVQQSQRSIGAAEGAQVVSGLLLELCRVREEGRRTDPGNVLVRRAQELVRERLESNLNASELAGLLEVSREHLTRVFKEQTGTTPYQFILRQRTVLACRLLQEGNLANKAIAARLGYSSPAHFLRSFRGLVGVTPGEFKSGGMTIPVL